MKKLAVFVEGYTELQFVDRIVEEIAGAHNVIIEHRRISGGVSVPRRMHMLQAARRASGEKLYVLIVDCTGDEQVKTRILEEHLNLTKSGYIRVIGVRDVRPKFIHAEILRLERGLPLYIKTSLIPVEWILSIMEIEAWFLAEHTHFQRISPAITPVAIRTALGFDPEHDDMSQRTEPAADLNACYALGGLAYSKTNSGATVAALDSAYVYLELRSRIPYLDKLLRLLDTFLQ
jgi:hypothetical protein